MKSQKEQLFAQAISRRIVELELNPVQGSFDSNHLKEVHQRMFQDLPSLGDNTFAPGEFRDKIPDEFIWKKERTLVSQNKDYLIVYSSMNEQAQAHFEVTLSKCRPEKLRVLNQDNFIQAMAEIYSELDYIHPFKDGNSRTFRTFTRQLASESGYKIEWSIYGNSQEQFDTLYKARDISVQKVGVRFNDNPILQRHYTRILNELGYKGDLLELMKNIISPLKSTHKTQSN